MCGPLGFPVGIPEMRICASIKRLCDTLLRRIKSSRSHEPKVLRSILNGLFVRRFIRFQRRRTANKDAHNSFELRIIRGRRVSDHITKAILMGSTRRAFRCYQSRFSHITIRSRAVDCCVAGAQTFLQLLDPVLEQIQLIQLPLNMVQALADELTHALDTLVHDLELLL
jgi:hypothetical protein